MHIGGQAVIEGVMMRTKEKFSVAVRLPNGTIKVMRKSCRKLPKAADLFLLRGIAGLGYMLRDGMKALIWSSNQQLGKNEQLSRKELAFTMAISFLFAAVFFIAIPFGSASLLRLEGMWFNILDGVFRVALFLGYLGIISRLEDVKTLFQYHGAEHKTIYCYEARKKVNMQNVKSFPRQHHRCGTSFLVLVIVLSIFLFSFVTGPWWVRLGSRILLLPVLAGLSYELIRLGDRYRHNPLMRSILVPGIWLQGITTMEPSEKQIEVAMKALEGVVGSGGTFGPRT